MADPTSAGDKNGMPRWVKVFVIIVIVLVLLVVILNFIGIAPEGGHGPGRHTPRSHSGSSKEQINSGVVGGPADAADAGRGRTIEVITLDAKAFEPSSINVAAGETVTFSVTNTGKDVHEFTLGDAAMQKEHADEMAGMDDGMAHSQANAVTVHPGETKQLTWRFAEAGTLEYGCHIPGHYEAGMRGQIAVT